jgi:molybdopterin synthase sulfur carrier subunit
MVNRSVYVSIRFFTTLKEIIGKREETLEFSRKETATVNNALERLAELHGKSFVEYVYDHDTHEVRSFLQILINGRNIASFQGLNTKLSDGDVLAIIPPVAGG